jgi:hypothetical protein
MAVKFEYMESGTLSGGGIAPFWVCDTCGEKIEGSGTAAFKTNDQGERTGEYLTIHKGKCETEETRRLQWERPGHVHVGVVQGRALQLGCRRGTARGATRVRDGQLTDEASGRDALLAVRDRGRTLGVLYPTGRLAYGVERLIPHTRGMLTPSYAVYPSASSGRFSARSNVRSFCARVGHSLACSGFASVGTELPAMRSSERCATNAWANLMHVVARSCVRSKHLDEDIDCRAADASREPAGRYCCPQHHEGSRCTSRMGMRRRPPR